MRRLKLFIATSLDGYIAGRDGDTSWRFRDGDYGYEAFLAGVDTALLGRRTYETALSFAQWPYPGRKVVVFTRSNALRVISPNTVATSRAPSDIIEDLRARDGKDLSLAGGGGLVPALVLGEPVLHREDGGLAVAQADEALGAPDPEVPVLVVDDL